MSVIILKRTFSLLFLFLLISNLLNAQRNTVSPYSRYGIGELQFSGNVSQVGMGNIGTAVIKADRINFINPASYAFDTVTTFEAATKGEYTKLSTSSTSQDANGASLSYLVFAFPVLKNKWGASIGAIPYSSVGYTITSQQVDPSLGRVSSSFKGDGGLSRFYLGNGYAPFNNVLNKFYASEKYKKLMADKEFLEVRKIEKRLSALTGFSIGLNASWIFGTLNQTRSVEFLDATNAYNTRIISGNSLGDFYFNAGMLYTCNLKKNHFLNIGLTGALSSNIKSRYNSLWYNYVSFAGQFETPTDSVQVIINEQGNTVIPMYYSGGFAFGKKGKWMGSIDVTMQDWSKFESSSISDSLTDSYNISAGGEWVPNRQGLSYFQKIQYRLGGHYYKSYVTINNTDIIDYGVSLGFGLPVINKDRIQKATLQLAFEAGQQGTTKNNLVKQEYVRFHIGITLNESWFYKRKYD